MPPIDPARNTNLANAAQASSAADLGASVLKRIQSAATGATQKAVPFGPAARKATGGGVPMPEFIDPSTKQRSGAGPVPMPTYMQGIGSLLPVRDVDPGFIDKSAKADGAWFKPLPAQPTVKPSAQPTSPAPNAPSGDSRITSLSDLSKLNPKFSLDQAKRLTSMSYQMFGAKSSFAEPIANADGYLATKPISIGTGLTLPAGTKIYSETGLKLGPMIQPGRAPAVNFELPNGKRLSLQGSFERTSGRSTMQITFADGKKFELPGAPFFNPNTGELGRVTRVFGTSGTNANPSYRLQNTLFNNSTKSAESVNGEMNGLEAQKSLADTLK
jgi:hypothetical protein